MSSYKTLFIIDKIEFKYFELNELVTSFWLIKECLERNWNVYITTTDRLSLKDGIPYAGIFKTYLIEENGKEDLIKDEDSAAANLNEFDLVIFRPDPPVDIDYINATYVISAIDSSKTVIVNNPESIRNTNEKLYVNSFPQLAPKNITTAKVDDIREFLAEHNEIIIKPLNKCFGKGVFYIKKGDANLNSIVETVTNGGQTMVMVQEYLTGAKNGDKRVLILGDEVLSEAITKLSGNGDFKFNTHNDDHLRKSPLSAFEQEIYQRMCPKLLEDGFYLVGLDVIDNKIIEVNFTSPCFFIKEINSMYAIKLEKKVVTYFESLLIKHKADKLSVKALIDLK